MGVLLLASGPRHYIDCMGNIYQSAAWASYQRSLGHDVVCAEGAGWRYVAVVVGGRMWRYLHCPYGPEADTPAAFDAALVDLARTAREKRCWFVRGGPGTNTMLDAGTTPEESFRRRGLHCTVNEGFMAYFREIDLEKTEAALIADMESTNRNLHRNIHKKGVTFSSSTDPQDIEILLPFLDVVAHKRHFNRISDTHLRQVARTLMPLGAATLYVARLHGKPIGASLAYDWEGTRTYAHTAMDFEHRRLSAGKPLVARMVLDAKEQGMTCFDLMGVAPDSGSAEDKSAAGFSEFKKSFGGRTVPYAGVWELPLFRWRYALYPTLLKARHEWIAGRRAAGRTFGRVRSRFVPDIRDNR
jgi:hypothetical protein